MKNFFIIFFIFYVNALNFGRIIGGTTVQHGMYPDVTWQVGLIIDDSTLCGGAILDSLHIITAAHCVQNVVSPASIEVRTGIDLYSIQPYRGLSIWVHPSYTYANTLLGHAVDLAVVKLNLPITLSNTVTPISIPQVIPSLGTYYVSGYGTTVSTSAGSSLISPNLLYVDVPSVDYSTCNAAAPFIVETTAICAGGVQGKDSCQGDSGGPLVTNIGSAISPDWILVGIVSTGTRVNNPLCAAASQYGIYSSVFPHRDFINGAIAGSFVPSISNANILNISVILILFSIII
jgi:secreted trypsin-like serine protease